MGGYTRHVSAAGAEPVSPKVGFAGVTGISRPMKNEEHWILYYFEAHAAQCESCLEPLRVSRLGRQLCDEGHRLAIDVADLLVRKDGEIYSRVRDGEKEVRVEVPHGYDQTISLLRAISHAAKKGERFLHKPRSHDRQYLVEDRLSADQRHYAQHSGNYATKIVEPKAPRSHPRRLERESSDNLVDPGKRGSLYNKDIRDLAEAEKREQRLRYNTEVRAPASKPSRRHHNHYS